MADNPAAQDLVTHIFELQTQLKLQLEVAQERYKSNADKHRKVHPSFAVGDRVWLIRQNIKTKHPCDKLDYRRIGPFTISKQINPLPII